MRVVKASQILTPTREYSLAVMKLSLSGKLNEKEFDEIKATWVSAMADAGIMIVED
jgi:hypothetical protein